MKNQVTKPHLFVYLLLTVIALVGTFSIVKVPLVFAGMATNTLKLTDEDIAATRKSTEIDKCGKKLEPTKLYGTIDSIDEDFYWWFEIRSQNSPGYNYTESPNSTYTLQSTTPVLRTAAEGPGQVRVQVDKFDGDFIGDSYYRLAAKSLDGRSLTPSNEAMFRPVAVIPAIALAECGFAVPPIAREERKWAPTVLNRSAVLNRRYVELKLNCPITAAGNCAIQIKLQASNLVTKALNKKNSKSARKNYKNSLSKKKTLVSQGNVVLKPGEQKKMKFKVNSKVRDELKLSAKYSRRSSVPLNVTFTSLENSDLAAAMSERISLSVRR